MTLPPPNLTEKKYWFTAEQSRDLLSGQYCMLGESGPSSLNVSVDNSRATQSFIVKTFQITLGQNLETLYIGALVIPKSVLNVSDFDITAKYGSGIEQKLKKKEESIAFSFEARQPIILKSGETLTLQLNDAASLAVEMFDLSGAARSGDSNLDKVTMIVEAANGTISPNQGLPFSFNRAVRNTVGSLAADQMNIVNANSTLENGDFEIVDDGTNAPYLRYKASNGTIYRWAGTVET